jgi:hypothetical protein
MSIIRTPDVYWKTTGPRTPWGEFDPNAQLNFSFDLASWIASAGVGLSLSGCEVASDPLLTATSQLAGELVTVRIRIANGQTVEPGTYLWFRLRMTLSDGQRDDRTFWLLARER